MGYTTYFTGEFSISPVLKKEHHNYLVAFSDIRHMKRDGQKTEKLEDPLRLAVGLPVGVDGEYFVNGDESTATDGNHPPDSQPGLYCQWIPDHHGEAIVWDGNEKFYDYIEWIQYLIDHFLKLWGYKINGKVKWEGEDRSDKGYIFIDNNTVYINETPTALDKLVKAVSEGKKRKKK